MGRPCSLPFKDRGRMGCNGWKSVCKATFKIWLHWWRSAINRSLSNYRSSSYSIRYWENPRSFWQIFRGWEKQLDYDHLDWKHWRKNNRRWFCIRSCLYSSIGPFIKTSRKGIKISKMLKSLGKHWMERSLVWWLKTLDRRFETISQFYCREWRYIFHF